jgi:eukaryotic-like serine/threonine-protein kinase
VPGSRSTTRALAQPRVGDVIADRFELEALCGTGGMSSVFRAHDLQLDRLVAIKILLGRYADDGEYVERFRREARAVAQLSHPNIVTVIDRGEDEGRQYIVFEYVEGENLKELIVRAGRLPVQRAVELALAVADGLAFAHEHGLVHRDVKPQNVLLSSGGEVKVTDFGIARSLDVEHGVTQTGTVMGTGEYLAPEQASGLPVSPATDVYSLGVVLWELLTGDVPFDGENFVAVALRHVNETLPSLRERRPDVPPRLAAAVERALQKDPALRFASMDEFARELRACLAAPDADEIEGATAVIPAPVAPPRTRRPIRTRRSWPIGYLILASALAAGALVAALALSGSHGSGNGSGGGGASGAPVQLSGVGDAYSNPGHPDDHANTAPSATDDSAATSWMTQTYTDQAFGGLLTGLGLVLHSESPVALSRLTVTTPTPGFMARIEVGDSPNGPFTTDSATLTVSSRTTFSLNGQSGSYYVVWLTELSPQLDAQISEVTARR